MAEVLRTVNTVSGGDHTTQNAALDWFATNYPNFVTADIQGVIECAGSNEDAISADITFASLTTDATRNLTVSGEGVGSTGIDTSIYRLNGNGCGYSVSTTAVDIKRLQLLLSGAGNNRTSIFLNSGTGLNILVDACRLENTATGTGEIGVGGPGSGSDSYVVRNCIIDGYDGYGIYITTGSWSLVYSIQNNTVYGCGVGIVARHATLQNNISVGNTTTDYGSSDGTIRDYNISSDATAPGSNSLINQVATDLMTDPANGDFTLKSGSAAIGAGTDLSAYFTTDITGATRSTWDAGAYFYTTGGGGSTYNQSTAWAIFNAFQRSSAWAILNGISRDTSWAVFNAHQQDTAWPIKNALNRSSSWKIFNQHDQSTAWPIYNISNQASAWKIFNLLDQESAWRTYNQTARDTAWRILNLSSVSIDTAWRILNASSSTISTAWAIYNAATRDTAWSIQNQAQADTAWRILDAGSAALQTAWAIYNTADIDSAWRIFNGTSVASSWKIYNFAGRDSAWNILTALQQDTAWQVFSSESLATAWAIDSELIPEPVKTFMAASRTVAFHAPSRTLIFFQ